MTHHKSANCQSLSLHLSNDQGPYNLVTSWADAAWETAEDE